MGKPSELTGCLWGHALSFLPENLDEMAVQTGAIRRRRGVETGEQLLRSFLLYASQGSFRTASALSKSSGLLDMTPEGLFYRLSRAEDFLESVLLSLTREMMAPVGFRMLIVDATTVCGPGSTGTDWRIHVGYDPVEGRPCSIRTTDVHTGESLALHPLGPGLLVVGDRFYGTAKEVHTALAAGSDVLVRVQQGAIRLVEDSGQRLSWPELATKVPSTGAVCFEFDMPVPPPGKRKGSGWKTSEATFWHRVRLMGARNREGEVVWLVTNLSPERLSEEQAYELYRVRWQVELYFKRLKSIGDLDLLNSRDGPTAKASLLAKLILLVLANLLANQEAFSPYGYRIRRARAKSMEGTGMHAPKTRLRNPSQQADKQRQREVALIKA